MPVSLGYGMYTHSKPIADAKCLQTASVSGITHFAICVCGITYSTNTLNGKLKRKS